MAHEFNDDYEDELVEEIPVYLSGPNDSIPGDLYLIQYPLRERGRPYGAGDGMGQLAEVLWKKELNCLELAYPLLRDNESQNFDPDALFSMNQLRLRSRGNPGAAAPVNFGVGMISHEVNPNTDEVEKSFVIRPVKGVMQIYPRFDHVDERLKKEALLDLDYEEEEEMKRKANEPKAVIAKAKKIKQNEAPDRPSWARLQREFAKDPWITLEIESTAEKDLKWDASREELRSDISFPQSSQQYLDYLAPISLDDVDNDIAIR